MVSTDVNLNYFESIKEYLTPPRASTSIESEFHFNKIFIKQKLLLSPNKAPLMSNNI